MRSKALLKRLLCIIISALLAFSAVACDTQDKNAADGTEQDNSVGTSVSDGSDTAEPYSVKFTVDGKEYESLSEGDQMPTPPEKQGYAFDGWYDGDTKLESLDALNGDVTLSAKWSLVTYTVTYADTKDVSHDNATSFTVESGAITLSPLSKTGYVFDGWYNGETKVTEIAAGSVGSITLTARWSPIVCNVTFTNTMGTTNSNPSSITVEDGVITLKPLMKDGYYFEGWYLDGNEVTQIKTDGQTSMTVEARWSKSVYGIFYANTKGVSHTNPQTYDVETETFALQPLSKLGYEFEGWYCGGIKYTHIIKGTCGHIDLEARWSPIICNVTFANTLGAENQNPNSFTVEDGVITLQPLSKDGYTFNGWYVNNVEVTAIEADGTTSMTVEARWTKIPYSITYSNTLGAQNVNPTAYDVETPTITLEALERSGYRFDGWFNGNTQITHVSYGSSGDLTLEARWTLIEYTLTYEDTYGATHGNATKYTVEDGDITLDEPTRDGYDFLGWYDGSVNVTVIDTAEARNITLAAKWRLSEYEIVYEGVNGASNPNPTSYTIETGKITLKDLTLEGYEFDGWFIGDDKVTEISEDSTGKVTLTAKWTAITYYITYENTNGQTHTNPASYTANDGEITLQPLEDDDPAMFGGWYLDGRLVSAIPADSTGDITLTARWSIPVYDADDLANMTLGGDYILMNDIDLEGAEWTPVGANAETPFTGMFNGDAHTISNFVIANGDAYLYYVGLFGYVSGSIINLNVEDFTYNVNVSTGSYYIGGIAAVVRDGSITDCSVSGDITVTRNISNSWVNVYDYYGGIVGYLADACEMENCDATVNITVVTNYTGYAYIGGMIGYAEKNITVKSSNARGAINVQYTYEGALGGMVGYAAEDADFTECSSEVDITVGNDSYVTPVGGIIGKCASGTIDGCTYDGEITYSRDYYYTYLNYVGGLAGITGTIKNSSASVTFTIPKESAHLYMGGLAGSATSISNCEATMSATLTNAYYYNVGGLVGGANKITDSHATVNMSAGLGEVVERYFGGLAGSATEILDCYATGTINGGSCTGGLVGQGSTVKNSYFTGSVTGAYYVGGIVGRGDTVTVITCYAEADVSSIGYGYAGGLVGLGDSEANVYNSYYMGDIVSHAKYYTYHGYVGGIVGYARDGGVFNCYAVGTIDATAKSSNANGNPPYVTVGGIGSVKSFENCFVSMDISMSPNSAAYGTIEYGKIVPQSGDLITVTNCYADSECSVEINGYSRYWENTYIEVAEATIENLKDDEWVSQNLFTSMNGSWTFENEYPELDFTADSSVIISTAEELMALSGKKLILDYKLGADISLANMTWTPMTVIGSFDGNGFTISDLTMKLNDDVWELGFISANRGTVKNLKLANLKITGNYNGSTDLNVGGLVARNYGTVDNCSIDGTLDCTNNTTSYDIRLGGLIGTNEGTVTNCSSNATVKSNNNRHYADIGGLIAYNRRGIVKKCFVTGTVTSSYNYDNVAVFVGGLVGEAGEGEISRCYSTATISSIGNKSSLYVGGIVGRVFSLKITDCYTSGDITASVSNSERYQSYVGGIAGYGSTIQNCYSTANISAGDSSKYAFVYAGGIAGQCEISMLENCYAAGTVEGKGRGNGYVGGLISANTTLDASSNCYRVSGQTVTLRSGTQSNAGTEAELATVLSVMAENWDASVWDFSSGSHPTLK